MGQVPALWALMAPCHFPWKKLLQFVIRSLLIGNDYLPILTGSSPRKKDVCLFTVIRQHVEGVQ